MSRSYDHGGNIFTVARALGVPVESIMDFSASINPLGLSALVRKALICGIDSLIHYPDSSHTDLRAALAKHHGLPAANMVIANGSTELIYNLPGMLPGNKALLISPCFSEYVRALNQHNWEVQHFTLTPETNFSIDMERLERALADGINCLYLCNPGNPNGTLYPQRVIEQVYRLCLSSGTFLVLDEAFMDFCEESSAKQFAVHSDNAIVLRSMTKFFGIPGLRLGYAIANPTLAGHLNSMGGPWSVNTLALLAGTAALKDDEYIQRTIEGTRQERRGLFKELERIQGLKVYPSCANFLLVEILTGISARELQERLIRHHIMIRDCASFMGLSERFFRIAVKSSAENQRLLDCLGRVMQ